MGARSTRSKNSIDISQGVIQDAMEDPEFLEQLFGARAGPVNEEYG